MKRYFSLYRGWCPHKPHRKYLFIPALRKNLEIFLIILGLLVSQNLFAQKHSKGKLADKPLYRDPVYDGAADPAII